MADDLDFSQVFSMFSKTKYATDLVAVHQPYHSRRLAVHQP
jgi:hypothetical protein